MPEKQNNESSIIRKRDVKLDIELSIRPLFLKDFIGKNDIKENLNIFIEASKKRSEALDHVLIYGPPGLGKTTLSKIIANEMGSGIKSIAAPVLSKVGDLVAVLTGLNEYDILFIDEIHRLNKYIEETLYSAMEDFQVDIIMGSGPTARAIQIKIQPFTLIGATTRLGFISNPLKDRFGIPIKLEFYEPDELKKIIIQCAIKLNIEISDKAAEIISKSSRGTPRIGIRILKRIRDFSINNNNNLINEELTLNSLNRLKIDEIGLDTMDYQYLNYILKYHNGGPVGVETIAAAISEEKETVEDDIEPYLIQIGFLSRTQRGRIVTKECINYFKNKL